MEPRLLKSLKRPPNRLIAPIALPRPGQIQFVDIFRGPLNKVSTTNAVDVKEESKSQLLVTLNKQLFELDISLETAIKYVTQTFACVENIKKCMSELPNLPHICFNHIIKQLEEAQKDEALLPVSQMQDWQHQIMFRLNLNLDHASCVYDHMNSIEKFSCSDLTPLFSSIMSSMKLSHSDIVKELDELYQLFETEVSDFSPAGWSSEKLNTIIPDLEEKKDQTFDNYLQFLLQKHDERDNILIRVNLLKDEMQKFSFQLQEDCKKGN